MIKTKSQHKKALDEISKLMTKDPKATSKEGKRLQSLAKEVSAYESIHYKFETVSPEDLKAFRRAVKRGLDDADNKRFVHSSNVKKLLKSKR